MTTRMKTITWILIAVVVVVVVVGLVRLPSSAERREKAEIEALRASRDEQDPVERIAMLERFLERFPQGKYRSYAYSYMFRAYLVDMADTAQAVLFARDMLASSEPVPDKAQLYPALMSFWREAGVHDSAAAIAREALAAPITDAGVYNEMGYELAETATHIDLAIQLCEKAVDLAEDDYQKSYCYDSLGWAYFQAGDRQKAVEAMEQAVKFAGEDVEEMTLMHLGQAQIAAGQAEPAVETFLKVMAMGEYDEARAKLDSLYVEVKGSSETLESDIKALRMERMTPAEDFTLASTSGEQVSLASYKGKVVVLNFMSPT